MRFVQSGMSPDDHVAVATVSAESGRRLDLTFTPDRRQILTAMHRVGLPNEIDRARDPLAFAFTEPGDQHIVITEQYAVKSTNVDAQSTQKIIAAIGQKVADDYMITRVIRHIADLGNLGKALDLVDGRKVVLYFSEGFDSRLVFGSVAHEISQEQTASDNDAILSGASWAIDYDKRYANAPVQNQLKETSELLRRSDCVVYPIDIAGLRTSSDGSVGLHQRGEDFLFALAHGTGGELIRNGNDIDRQIARIEEKTSLTYVLSYSSSRPPDGKFHALRVRTKVKHARVSARAGYYDRVSFGHGTPLERLLSASNVIAQGKPAGDYPLEVLAFAASGDKVPRIPVLISIPASALAGRDANGRTPLEIYAYAFDASDQIVDYFARSTVIDHAAQAAASSGITFFGLCRALPGTYRLRVYVRNLVDGRFGYSASTLEVPDFQTSRIQALTPFFVRENGGEGLYLRDASVGSEPDPFAIGGASYVPQVLPTVRSGSKAHVCLMVVSRSAPGTVPALEVGVRVVDGSGRSIVPSDVHVLGRSTPNPDGLLRILVDFVPTDLSPGSYRFRVTFRDKTDRTESESETPFRVS